MRRFRGAGRDVGRVYAARDEETGAPAVMVGPGRVGDWRPVRGWKLTVLGGDQPRRASLRVDRAPRGASLADLSTLLLRLALVVGDLARRRDAREHLMTPGWRLRPPPRLVLPAALAVVAVVALVLLPLRVLERPELPPVEAARTSDEAPSAWAPTQGVFPAGPMPAKPFERQKRPPCDPELEDEVRGGCWTRLKSVAPCPAKAYEHEGQCYLPTLAAPKPSQSIQP
ncbi:hypothetical protein [Cystobacter fuscus]|uniref:hypothetical protein n=1 Tax=Cystobacter fuscus TaxID=43 RepID=UPI0012FDEDD9|nr:hypothetical protein [Cystobacter fuscus]